jgi:hypothetical protein
MPSTSVTLPYSFEAEVLLRLDQIIVFEAQCLQVLDQIIAGQAALTVKVNNMANTINDVITAVAAEKGADDSMVTLIEGFAAQLTAALAAAGQGVTPAQQALIDTAVANATANAAEINAAIAANPLPAPVTPAPVTPAA